VLNRLFVSILIVALSFVLVTGQIPDSQKLDADRTAKVSGVGGQKMRDFAFSKGIDLQFLVKELAHELDLNVLFDPESFRTPGRITYIDLKNVTAVAALDYILLQEGLCFEEAGPKTILVAVRARQQGIPQIGLAVLPMSDQLAQYFGVDGGILINMVRDDSTALKAGLKAGDVIVEIDGVPIRGPLGLMRIINDKNQSDFILKVVRDRKARMISLTYTKGIQSVL